MHDSSYEWCWFAVYLIATLYVIRCCTFKNKTDFIIAMCSLHHSMHLYPLIDLIAPNLELDHIAPNLELDQSLFHFFTHKD